MEEERATLWEDYQDYNEQSARKDYEEDMRKRDEEDVRMILLEERLIEEEEE